MSCSNSTFPTICSSSMRVEDGKPYREAMIPAAAFNPCPLRVLDDEEVAELTTASFRANRPRTPILAVLAFVF